MFNFDIDNRTFWTHTNNKKSPCSKQGRIIVRGTTLVTA